MKERKDYYNIKTKGNKQSFKIREIIKYKGGKVAFSGGTSIIPDISYENLNYDSVSFLII